MEGNDSFSLYPSGNYCQYLAVKRAERELKRHPTDAFEEPKKEIKRSFTPPLLPLCLPPYAELRFYPSAPS